MSDAVTRVSLDLDGHARNGVRHIQFPSLLRPSVGRVLFLFFSFRTWMMLVHRSGRPLIENDAPCRRCLTDRWPRRQALPDGSLAAATRENVNAYAGRRPTTEDLDWPERAGPAPAEGVTALGRHR